MQNRLRWLFSYGSNSPQQLAGRLGHAVLAVPAYLGGWQRVYRGRSRAWNGGVGSLEPGDGIVLGNACQLDDRDLGLVDDYEGAPVHYIRQSVRIHVIDEQGDRKVQALVYLSTAENGSPPSCEYLDAIAENVNSVWRKSNGKPYRAVDFAPTATELT